MFVRIRNVSETSIVNSLARRFVCCARRRWN